MSKWVQRLHIELVSPVRPATFYSVAIKMRQVIELIWTWVEWKLYRYVVILKTTQSKVSRVRQKHAKTNYFLREDNYKS